MLAWASISILKIEREIRPFIFFCLSLGPTSAVTDEGQGNMDHHYIRQRYSHAENHLESQLCVLWKEAKALMKALRMI